MRRSPARRMRASLVVVSLVVLGLLPAFGATGAKGAEKEIRVGCLLPLSGHLSNTGNLYRRAYELTVKAINQGGGVRLGDKALPLRLIVRDSQSDGESALRQAEKLIAEERPVALTGPFGYAQTKAVAELAAAKHLPLIQGGSTAPELFERENRWFFGTLPAVADHFLPAVLLLGTLPRNLRTVALVATTDRFNSAAAAGLRSLLQETMESRPVVDEKFEIGWRSFAPVVEAMKKSAVLTVFVAMPEDESREFVAQMKRSAWSPTFVFLGAGVNDADLRKSLGSDGEGLCGVSPWEADVELRGEVFGSSREFVRLYREAYNKETPDYHSAAAALCLLVLKKALENAGSTDPERVREALATVRYNSVFGDVAFRPDGQLRGWIQVLQIQGGQAKVVFPSVELKVVFPLVPWKDRRAPPSVGDAGR